MPRLQIYIDNEGKKTKKSSSPGLKRTSCSKEEIDKSARYWWKMDQWRWKTSIDQREEHRWRRNRRDVDEEQREESLNQ